MNSYDISMGNLVQILKESDNVDSYLASPVYYLMTGRKGGKIFNNHVIALKHPNKDNSILVFPCASKEYGLSPYDEEIEVAKKIKERNTQTEVRLARIPKDSQLLKNGKGVEEELLDWKYPVHILGVNEVVRLKGKGFQQIRQRVNNLNTEKCECYDVDISEHYDIIKLLSIEWASDFPYDTYMKEDLVSPIETLLKLMNHSELNICGQIIDYEGIPSAFCIWEERNKVANAFAMTAKRDRPGLAEYNIVQMCRKLQKKGIKKVNMGGSESEGLNRYKKKFAPIESLELKSFIVG